MRKLLCFIGLLSVALPLMAQVEGRVRSANDGELIPGVIVTAKRVGEKRILSYARADGEGKFKLNMEPSRGILLHFSMLGYAKDSLELREGQSYYDIQLREQVTLLKEVSVKAQPITAHGDTIKYLVSNFSEIQDKSLADVLKKMPGIEISDGGQIKYQGQAINRFYIEGRDMLGGHYGIATNTIHPDDVGSVEVMENHQPIRALEDISFSQNPAINIRLKKDAKSHWVGTITLGGGYKDMSQKLLFNGQATAMRFKKKNQVLFTGKSTNAGKPANAHSSNLMYGVDDSPFGREYSIRNPLSIAQSVPYQLERDRTRQGPSHMVSMNNLWGLGENIDLTSKVNYSHRTDLARSRSEMIYFLSDGNRIIEGDENSEAHDQNLHVESDLLINKSKFYLSNRLLGNFDWNDMGLVTKGTYANQQSLRGEQQGVENRLNLLVRKGASGISLSSFLKWQRRPSALMVKMPSESLAQNIDAQLFFTNTSTSLSYVIGRVVMTGKVGVATMHRTLASKLSSLEPPLAPTENSVTACYYQLYATPKLAYGYKSFKGELEWPIAWTYYRMESGKATNLHRYPLTPRLRLELQATNRLMLSATARFRNEMLDDQDWFSGYILTNYRTLTLGLEELGNRKSGQMTLNANYRNALESLFANASVSYNKASSSHLSSRNFLDRYMILQPVAMESRGDNWSMNGSVSKGFMWLRSILTFNALYSSSNQELLLQGKLTPYSFNFLRLGGQVFLQPMSWVSLQYEVSYNRNGQAVTGEVYERRHNYAQRLNLVFTPSKSWRIELMANHYYNEISKNTRKHYLLLDASLSFSAPGGWEINLSGRNLFNNRTYGYTSLSSITSYKAEYQIRPLELLLGVFFRY